MTDLIFVALFLMFFTTAAALVRACERIVGRAEVTPLPAAGVRDQEGAAA